MMLPKLATIIMSNKENVSISSLKIVQKKIFEYQNIQISMLKRFYSMLIFVRLTFPVFTTLNLFFSCNFNFCLKFIYVRKTEKFSLNIYIYILQSLCEFCVKT